MSYRPWEMALGAVVLVVAAGFAAVLVWGSGQRPGLSQGAGHTLTASFRSAEGVRPGTEVRLAGVRVGSVTDLTLDTDTFRAEVTLRIDAALSLPADSTAAVASEGLLGGTFIEIIPGGMPFDLEPGDAFQDTQSAVSLVQLMLRFATGGDGAEAGTATGAGEPTAESEGTP